MNEDDVVKAIREFIETHFPRNCENFGKRFKSMADYLHNTTHIEKPISYDADDSDWKPSRLIGTFAMSNCSCGNTLTIGSTGMSLITLWRVMNWARKENKRYQFKISFRGPEK